MAAATQYLAVPLFAFACLLLLHKSSPVGTGKHAVCFLIFTFLNVLIHFPFFHITGLCLSIYDAAGLNTASLLTSISAATQFNSSALAIEVAAQPYLTGVLTTLAGANMMGTQSSGPSPTEAIQLFATKLSTIYSLPAAPAVALCRSFIAMHSLLWFTLTAAGLLAWKFRPGLIVGSRNVAIPIPEVSADN